MTRSRITIELSSDQNRCPPRNASKEEGNEETTGPSRTLKDVWQAQQSDAHEDVGQIENTLGERCVSGGTGLGPTLLLGFLPRSVVCLLPVMSRRHGQVLLLRLRSPRALGG